MRTTATLAAAAIATATIVTSAGTANAATARPFVKSQIISVSPAAKLGKGGHYVDVRISFKCDSSTRTKPHAVMFEGQFTQTIQRRVVQQNWDVFPGVRCTGRVQAMTLRANFSGGNLPPQIAPPCGVKGWVKGSAKVGAGFYNSDGHNVTSYSQWATQTLDVR